MNKTYALHIGINDYDGAPLYGCVNDAFSWAERTGSTNLLLDSDATRANIMRGIRDLFAQARFGDMVYVTYSGHGSRVPDRDGDEADGYDEVLVPYDWQGGRHISDDHLHALWQERRYGVRVMFISDSCNSGTVSRLMRIGLGRPRYFPAGILTGDDQLDRSALPHRRNLGSRLAGTILLAAAQDDESAWDATIGGRPQGAFTAAAIWALDKHPRNLKHWFSMIDLPTAAFPQNPRLGASKWQQYLDVMPKGGAR